MMTQILLTIGILVLLPLLLGHALAQALGLYLQRRWTSVLFRYLMGYLLSWALFQIPAVPLIWNKYSLHALVGVWLATMAGAILIFFGIAQKRGFGILADPMGVPGSQDLPEREGGRADLRSLTWWSTVVLFGILAFVIGWQIWKAVCFSYANADDAVFLNPTLDAVWSDTMFRMDADTGEMLDWVFGSGRKRDLFSPFQMYLAAVSYSTAVHPTILAHTVLPPFLILLEYAVFGLVGGLLFPGERRSQILLAIFAGEALTFFGGATRTPGVAALIRLWQGKSVVAAVVLPALFFFLLLWKKEREMRGPIWILLLITSFAGCLLSATGIITVPILVLSFGIWYTIEEKKPAMLLQWLLAIAPSILYALLNQNL